jgi:hypothetical protein
MHCMSSNMMGGYRLQLKPVCVKMILTSTSPLMTIQVSTNNYYDDYVTVVL